MILLLIAVLAVLSAAFLIWAVRRNDRALPASSRRISETTDLRPLFEPSREELREEEAREIARREVSARAEKRAKIDASLQEWRNSRSVSKATELLAVTAESGDARDFSRAAEEIIQEFERDSFTLVAPTEVADLLESHRLLLPVTERSSGRLFWLKEEVAKLRSRTSGSAAQKPN
jgi:hypothetical protein